MNRSTGDLVSVSLLCTKKMATNPVLVHGVSLSPYISRRTGLSEPPSVAKGIKIIAGVAAPAIFGKGLVL